MNEEVYLNLSIRLNENPIKVPPLEGYLKILKEIYTKEQAALGADFPLGAHTLKELATQLNRDETELKRLLETMAYNGLVFTSKNQSGEHTYSLTPFVPGVVELVVVRSADTPKAREVARLMSEFKETMEGLLSMAKENPQALQEMMPEAPTRIITVEKELPVDIEIYPYEQLIELVKQEQSFAATLCPCRELASLADNPCKAIGVPRHSCLSFGAMADYIVEQSFGKRISKDECLDILEVVEKAGLVHTTNNSIGGLGFVCNCCGCCCGFLNMLKDFNINPMVAFSNFVLSIDAGGCSGCGDCITRCQVEALDLVDEVAIVNKDRCIGCGNCVSICPTGCLVMERRCTIEPPEPGPTFAGLGV